MRQRSLLGDPDPARGEPVHRAGDRHGASEVQAELGLARGVCEEPDEHPIVDAALEPQDLLDDRVVKGELVSQEVADRLTEASPWPEGHGHQRGGIEANAYLREVVELPLEHVAKSSHHG